MRYSKFRNDGSSSLTLVTNIRIRPDALHSYLDGFVASSAMSLALVVNNMHDLFLQLITTHQSPSLTVLIDQLIYFELTH